MSRITHGTLVANTVTTVAVDSYMAAITVTNRSIPGGEIYFTVDGSTPTIGGTNCFVALGSRTVQTSAYTSISQIKLISTAALAFSVEGEAS